MTTRTWHDGFVRIPGDAWIDGGTPKSSSIVPWSVETIENGDVEFRQGRLDPGLVERATNVLTGYVEAL